MDHLNTMNKQVIDPPSFIKSELTNLFQSEFVKVVSDTIDSELQKYQTHFENVDEAKDKFCDEMKVKMDNYNESMRQQKETWYNDLESSKENDFPELIDYKGCFKLCGNCRICDAILNKKGEFSHCTMYTDGTFLKSLDTFNTGNVTGDLLACSRKGLSASSDDNRCITYFTSPNGDQYNDLHTQGTFIKVDSYTKFPLALYGTQPGGGRIPAVYSEYVDDDIYLSKEYIELINSVYDPNLRPYHRQPADYIHNNIIHIYKKYHPKATEICKIEMKQKEIQKSIIELQSLETKYATQKAHLDKIEQDINDQYEKLKKNQQVHKDKLKNLFQREKSVQMKETLHGCKEELKDIALQLNDMYVLTDSPDESIQSKLNDILCKLNTLYAETIQPAVMAEHL